MVCAIARTGSNLLCDGLHSTRRAGRGQQFFLPKFEEDLSARHALDARNDFAGYVRGIMAAASWNNRVFSFKVMAWYLQDFLARLRGPGAFGQETSSDLEVLNAAFPRLKFVQILRRNKLLQAISKARAIQTGMWKVQEGNAAKHEPQFDAALIAKCLNDVRKDETVWSDFFIREGISPFLVWYEELCENYEGTIRGVVDHLKITLARDAIISPPRTIRQADSLSTEWERRYLALSPSDLVSSH